LLLRSLFSEALAKDGCFSNELAPANQRGARAFNLRSVFVGLPKNAAREGTVRWNLLEERLLLENTCNRAEDVEEIGDDVENLDHTLRGRRACFCQLSDMHFASINLLPRVCLTTPILGTAVVYWRLRENTIPLRIPLGDLSAEEHGTFVFAMP
jgi:hypothetical protein